MLPATLQRIEIGYFSFMLVTFIFIVEVICGRVEQGRLRVLS